MRHFINIAVAFMFSALLFNSAMAQTPPAPTVLSQADIEAIVGKKVPDKISVGLSEESEEAVALKSCEKVLGGLKVPKDCCKDPKCVGKVLKKKADDDHRAEINKKYCTEYGGASDTCSDPESARSFVIKYREERDRKKAELSGQADKDKQLRLREDAAKTAIIADQAKRDAEEASRILERARAEAEKVGNYTLTPVKSHFLDMGVELIAHTSGAYGGAVYANYRPPILGDRLSFGLGVGGLVVTRNRLELGNFDPVFRMLGEVNASFRVLNWDDFNAALGVSYARLGKFSDDGLTANMVGPTATVKIGSLRLNAEYMYNTGPVDGYLDPGWRFMFMVGFDFLRTNLAGR